MVARFVVRSVAKGCCYSIVFVFAVISQFFVCSRFIPKRKESCRRTCRSRWSKLCSELVCNAATMRDWLCAATSAVDGPVAQRSEQGTHNPLVGCSNPSGPTSLQYRKHLKPFNSFSAQTRRTLVMEPASCAMSVSAAQCLHRCGTQLCCPNPDSQQTAIFLWGQ